MTDVLQPEFEASISPYLEVFDISAVIQALIDRLSGLKGEIDIELEF